MRTHSILTWNTGLRDSDSGPTSDRVARILKVLSSLVANEGVDLLCLQEVGCRSIEAVTNTLRRGGFSTETFPDSGLVTAYRARAGWCQVGVAWSGDRWGSVVLSRSSLDVEVFNLHLPSLLHRQSEDQADEARIRAEEVARRRFQHPTRVEEILAGDFNLEPFARVMRDKSGFRGTRCNHQVQRLRGEFPRRVLFNPTWALLGRLEGSLGTYYRSPRPWYVFDQVLVSAGLAGSCGPAEVITKTGGLQLASARVGKPDSAAGSDHFPLQVRFKA